MTDFPIHRGLDTGPHGLKGLWIPTDDPEVAETILDLISSMTDEIERVKAAQTDAFVRQHLDKAHSHKVVSYPERAMPEPNRHNPAQWRFRQRVALIPKLLVALEQIPPEDSALLGTDYPTTEVTFVIVTRRGELPEVGGTG